MSSKRVLTIGFELASPDTQQEDFRSKTSLLDWDIVLFNPQIDNFVSYSDDYQGKPSLNDKESFRLKECCEHWRREIKQAFDTGKTVIVFLPSLQVVYIDTGDRTYSGTGRNQKITHHVAQYDNYKAIPVTFSPITATGHSMKLSVGSAAILDGVLEL